MAGEAVAAATDGDLQVVGARVLERGDHVGDARTTRDQRRALVERAVPDRPCDVVAAVARLDHVALQAQRGGGGLLC
jgi:hypothetical protein